MSYSFTPQTFANVNANDARTAARKFHGLAVKGSRTAFTNALHHAHALKALDDARKAKALVSTDGKPLTKPQLIEWVGTLERAMFNRYVQAASFTPEQVEGYVEWAEGKNKTPHVTGLVDFYAEKQPKEDKGVVAILTIPKTDDAKGGSVTMYADGTFKVSNGLDEKRARKVVKNFQKFSTFGA